MPEWFTVRLILNVTLVMAGAWGLATVLRRASPAIRHLVWACALFATLALPAVTRFAPRWSIPILPAVSGAFREAPAIQLSAERDIALPRTPDIRQTWGAPHAVFRTVRHLDWRTLAVALWLAGGLLGLLRLALSLLEVRRMAHNAEIVTERAWMAQAAETAEILGVKVQISLRYSDHVCVPITCGLLRPVLLLPVDAKTWSAERRRAVLLHELAHVKRWDVFVRFCGQAATVLYWFHPLIHLAMRRLQIEQEHACDDVVLAAGVGATAYAGHLFDIARRSVSTPLGVTVAMARPSHLEDRVLSILDPTRSRCEPARRVRLVVSCLVGGVALLMGALQVTAREEQRLLPAGMHTTLPNGATLELREYFMPGEWLRYVEPVTRARVRSVLVAAQNDADDQVREEITRAVAILDAQPSGRFVVRGPCRANCVVEDSELEAFVHARQVIWGGSLIVDETGLSSADVEVRRRAAMKGGALRFRRGMAALASALMDTDHTVRMWAAIRLDSVRAVEAIPGWIWLLGDADASLRERAAISLGIIGDPQAVEPLTSTIFTDPESFVRRQAVRSLLFIAAGEDL